MPSQSSNAIEFTFDGPNPLPTEADLRAATGTVPEIPATAPPVEAVAVPAPVAAAPAAVPAEATADPLATPVVPVADPAAPELRTHKIVVDGQELEVTEADLKSGHMRLRDYTQKTQKLSEERKTWETERAQLAKERADQAAQLQAIDEFLRNQAAIDAYRQKAFGPAAVPPPSVDPNQPITAQQVADIARYNAEQVRIATQRDMATHVEAAKAAALQVKREVELGKLETAVDSHIASILDKYPVLKRFEDISDELIGEASKYQPKNLDEARARLSEAADRRIAVMRTFAEDEKKAAAVAAAKLRQTSPEPAGGQPAKGAAPRKLTFDPKDRSARIDAGVETVRAYLDAQGS